MKKIYFAEMMILFLCIAGSTQICLAQGDDQIRDTSFQLGNWQMEWIPDKTPYPSYLADPRRPRMHMGVGATGTDIPETSSGLINLDAGTRVTLLKMQRGSDGANEFSLDVEGALFTRFDLIRGLDNYGWDGRYGIYAAWDWSDTIMARFGHRHISSHLGDEYMENTGTPRFNYTRNDLRMGWGIQAADGMLFYVEPSWAWYLGNDRLKKWIIEGGYQYQGPYTAWKDSMAWYGGIHIASFQENGWNPSVSCQVGVKLKRDPKQTILRFAVEGYAGRAVLGEFALDYNEAYLSAGFFFDYF